MGMTIDKMYYGNYGFVVEIEASSETGYNLLTVWVAEKAEVEFAHRQHWSLGRRGYDRDMLQPRSCVYGEAFPLRDFYFEEANGPHIRSFYHRFALDEGYRKLVLAGETRWARRNELFARNLPSLVGAGYDRQTCAFFRWIDAHLEEILVLPEYQRLKQEDSAFETSVGERNSLAQGSATGVVGFEGGPAPGGILPSRLAWLCQPERIERTLRLLFYLNHWARARQQLPHADRQGLYQVKAAVVQQAFAVGLLKPVSYIDGSSGFADGFSLNLAAGMAVEAFIDRLAWLLVDDEYLPADGEENDSTVLSLFARIMGRRATSSADIEALDVEGTKAFIQEHLAALIAQARTTRLPILESELASLCLEPRDLLSTHWIRNCLSAGWSDLDESETVQLDPEGLSLVAFEYVSARTHYIFHLPFRVAERFLPQPLVRDLKSRPGNSRECGEHCGRTITEQESREYPVVDILRELGVDGAAICPSRCTEKPAHVSSLARKYAYCDGEEEDEEDRDVEDWPIPSWLESQRRKGERIPGRCSLCAGAFENLGGGHESRKDGGSPLGLL